MARPRRASSDDALPKVVERPRPRVRRRHRPLARVNFVKDPTYFLNIGSTGSRRDRSTASSRSATRSSTDPAAHQLRARRRVRPLGLVASTMMSASSASTAIEQRGGRRRRAVTLS
jgi:hypothetical protein